MRYGVKTHQLEFGSFQKDKHYGEGKKKNQKVEVEQQLMLGIFGKAGQLLEIQE